VAVEHFDAGIGTRFDYARPKGLRDGKASSHFAEQFAASLKSTSQSFIRLQRIEDGLHDKALILRQIAE
jgi:hypothetical protein